MRLVILAAALAVAHGYTNTGDYGVITVHNFLASPFTPATACDGDPKSTYLVRIMPEFDADDYARVPGFATGGCMNFKKGDGVHNAGAAFNTAIDVSMAITKNATANKYDPVVGNTTNCYGTMAIPNDGVPTNYQWDLTSAQGQCGATTNGTHKGIQLETGGAPKDGLGMKLTVHTAKQHIVGNIVGPFTNATCSDSASSIMAYPLVIPLEDSGTEKALTANSMQCTDISFSTAGPFYFFKVNLTATAGELQITYAHGGTTFTGRDGCTSTTDANNYISTFVTGIRGNVSSCVNATNGTTNQNKYFQFVPAVSSIGSNPNQVALPSVTPTACPSPASALRLSGIMAVLTILIALAF